MDRSSERAGYIIRELMDPYIARYPCRKADTDRCRCEHCVRERAEQFLIEIGMHWKTRVYRVMRG